MGARTTFAVHTVSLLVIAGLAALAVPALMSLLASADAVGSNIARTLASPRPADAEIVDAETESGDELGGPDPAPACERYTDHGVNAYASGEVVDTAVGRVVGYRVAPGDTLIGIMERFCTPSSAHIFYANGMHLRGSTALAPGEVIALRR